MGATALLRTRSLKFLEDFGLELNEDTVPRDKLNYFIKKRGLKPEIPTMYFYDNDTLKEVASLDTSPVIRVNALWVSRDLKLRCGVADTIERKRQGLQGKRIEANEGLFFPYAGPTDVTFHQGSVDYPLDIMFLRGNRIVEIEADTKVGGKERWACKECDCVIETNGGFCHENNVSLDDKLAYFAVSKQDEIDLQQEKELSMSLLALAAELI